MNELKVSLEVSSSTSLPSKTILHVFPNACAYLITLTDNTKLKAFTYFYRPKQVLPKGRGHLSLPHPVPGRNFC